MMMTMMIIVGNTYPKEIHVSYQKTVDSHNVGFGFAALTVDKVLSLSFNIKTANMCDCFFH